MTALTFFIWLTAIDPAASVREGRRRVAISVTISPLAFCCWGNRLGFCR